MTVTASQAIAGIPMVTDDTYVYGNANAAANVINPGDWVIWSGSGVAAAEDAQAYFKVSGAGIALDRNPVLDRAGRTVVNSALMIATRGLYLVSASFSGRPLLGVLAYPVSTGSGVAVSTGVTGVGATWNTAAPVQISANPTGGPSLGVATLVASYPSSGLAGTGQMLIRLRPVGADWY
jgi:hypothetical protein